MDNNNNIDWGGWILTLIMLSVFWPVGVVLLIKQLTKTGRQLRRQRESRATGGRVYAGSSGVKRHPYDIQHDAELNQEWANAKTTEKSTKKSSKSKSRKNSRKQDTSKGRVLMIVGGCIAGVFGLALLATIGDILSWGWYSYHLEELFSLTGFFASGLVCLGVGLRQRRQARRFKKYMAYIGKNKSISLAALAAAMGVKEKTICEDLQDMLDSGVLPTGYIDLAAGRLVLSDEGISDFVAEPEPEEAEPAKKVGEDENAILQEIRDVNDAIPDEVMSEKIDRIGEITGKILDYQRSHPSKSGQLRSFLNYYLPTTLKVLRAYAQLDAQGIEGENITAAKKRIEGMMDQVVDGFEKQLDKLFQDDALDITSDVEVLENMLRQDGLSGGMTMTTAPEKTKETSAQQAYLDLQKVADELEDVVNDDDDDQGITLSI